MWNRYWAGGSRQTRSDARGNTPPSSRIVDTPRCRNNLRSQPHRSSIDDIVCALSVKTYIPPEA
jgi:hypothetical protein